MVDSIGASLSTGEVSGNNNIVSQEEFIRLFIAQLNNQDPMEPVDNSQFLAQMAQFTSLEQTRLINDNLVNMLSMESNSQGLTMLGKSVQVNNLGTIFSGIVEGVHFNSSGVMLTIEDSNGNILSDISLTQISAINQ